MYFWCYRQIEGGWKIYYVGCHKHPPLRPRKALANQHMQDVSWVNHAGQYSHRRWVKDMGVCGKPHIRCWKTWIIQVGKSADVQVQKNHMESLLLPPHHYYRMYSYASKRKCQSNTQKCDCYIDDYIEQLLGQTQGELFTFKIIQEQSERSV